MEGQDDREENEDQRTRATWEHRQNGGNRDGDGRDDGDGGGQDGGGLDYHGQGDDRVATVAATDDSVCHTRHRRAVTSQAGKGRRVAGSLGRHRAGRWDRARIT